MSAAIVIRPTFLVLETVQAMAVSPQPRAERRQPVPLHLVQACPEQVREEKCGSTEAPAPQRSETTTVITPAADRAGHPFYRKYTEGMLRRYSKLSMESGRVPSMLGQEMFRGKVTSYKVQSFDDVVIFVNDVERCVNTLSLVQRHLTERIALQGYSQGETAALLGVSLRTVIRRYNAALDELTRMFLRKGMLKPLSAYAEECLPRAVKSPRPQ